MAFDPFADPPPDYHFDVVPRDRSKDRLPRDRSDDCLPPHDRFDGPSRDRFDGPSRDGSPPFDRITDPPSYDRQRPAPVEGRSSFGRHHEPAGTTSPAGTSWRLRRRGRRRRADDTGEYGGRRRAPDSADTGQWDRMTDTGQYVRTATTGDWDRLTDTGSHSRRDWDRMTDTGSHPRRDWDRMTDTGAHERAIAWDRLNDTGSHTIADDRAQERFEAFWSGHRLAGDDPRWVATPTSAPRSPAISYPERRRVDDPVPRPRAPRPATRAAAPPPPVRRPVAAPPGVVPSRCRTSTPIRPAC